MSTVSQTDSKEEGGGRKQDDDGKKVDDRQTEVLAAGENQLADCLAVIDMEMHIEERDFVSTRVCVCSKCFKNHSHLLKLLVINFPPTQDCFNRFSSE